jgi:hypothetical protein
VFVDDTGFAADLRKSLEEAMREGASALRPQEWEGQPLARKLLIWTTYWIARSVISFLGFERYH